VLPDYMALQASGLVRVLSDVKAPKVDVYFVYPEELRNSKRVAVFRDFLLARLHDR
jgi:DNA-binding transcriptional LysR family regulator